jgi:hypothetical protein
MRPIRIFHRLLWVLAVLLCSAHAKAQINKAEYFFDTDPGFGNATGVTVTTGTDINFSFNPSIASLANGLHRLFVRTQSADGQWSQAVPQLLYKEAVVTNVRDSIVKMEWFIDTDTGFHAGGPVAMLPTADTTLTFVAPVHSLPHGLHRMFVRAQDATGAWSLTSQQLFYREAVATSTLSNITKAEYFIDTDPGFGNATDIPLSAGTDISFSFNPSIASVSNGLHRLFVRTQDAAGKWSLTTQQLFYKEAVVNSPVLNITKAEFFFDADPGFGNAIDIPVTAGADITYTFNGDISSLSNGLHRLFVRTQDAAGKWSLTTQQLFYKEAVVVNPLVNVVQAEYFIDNDPGFGSATQIPVAAGQDIVINFNGDISSLSNGLHRLFVRTKDAAGKWSLTTQQMFFKEGLAGNTYSNLVTLEYFWDNDPGFGNATRVTLPANSGELTDYVFNVITPSNLAGAKHNLFIRVLDATDWSLTTVKMVDFTGITLPVTLLDFSARALQEKVAVKWITTNEINNKHFEVERSIDGVQFAPLGIVAAKGTGGGQTIYDFTDEKPVQGMNYYRLKQVDLNGRFTYTPVVAIRFDKAGYLVQVYPNPATSFFTVRSDKRFTKVELADMNGRLVQHWQVQADNQYRLANLAKGMYVVRLTEQTGNVITKTILVDK